MYADYELPGMLKVTELYTRSKGLVGWRGEWRGLHGDRQWWIIVRAVHEVLDQEAGVLGSKE